MRAAARAAKAAAAARTRNNASRYKMPENPLCIAQRGFVFLKETKAQKVVYENSRGETKKPHGEGRAAF